MKTFNLTMTLEERMNVPTIDAGQEFKFKLADLDKLIIEIRKQREEQGLGTKIQLLPNKIKKYHEPSFSPTFVKDPVTGVYYGIIIGYHPDGNPKWMKIPMGESLFLDISKVQEAKMWAVLRMHPSVDVSPFVESEPRYRVLDPEVEATKKMTRGMMVGTCLHKVKTMKKDKLKNFARWCNIPLVGDESPLMIRSLLSDLAIDNPTFFEGKFNDGSRSIGEIFKSANQLGIIKFSTDKGYSFDNIKIGLTEYDALDFLSRENAVVDSLAAAIRKLDKQAEDKIGGFDEKEKEKDDKEE